MGKKIHYARKLKEYKNFFSRSVYIKFSRSQLVIFDGKNITFLTGHGTTDWFQIGKKSTSRLYIVTLLI